MCHVQIPDWHPGLPSSNTEIFNQTVWQKNMKDWFSLLTTTYPQVTGRLIVDLINVSSQLLTVPYVYNAHLPLRRCLHVASAHFMQ